MGQALGNSFPYKQEMWSQQISGHDLVKIDSYHVYGMAEGLAVDQHSFKKLSLRKFPKLDKKESSEGSFWKKYQVNTSYSMLHAAH